MRPSGRAPDQLRTVTLEPGFAKYAEGSCLVRFGDTHVLCTASVDDSVPRFLKGTGLGWVTAEYGMLPRSTHSRTDREAAKGKQSGRTQEIQRLIGRALRAVTNRAAMPEVQIKVDCDVLQADGGTRTAAITGAWLAARIAVQRLLDDRKLPENPLSDSVAAVSVGLCGGRELLDLAYIEDRDAEADFNVVMTGQGQFVEVQGSGEETTYSRAQLDGVLALAEKGLRELAALQAAFLARQLLKT